jgi:hypothetical protein
MLQGWQINSVVQVQGGQPWSGRDLTNDISGTGLVNDVNYAGRWNFSGNPADFTSGPSVIPCWSGSGGAALAGCSIGGATAPTACTTAAAAISANTVSALNSIGCYVKGNSALFPSALGTFGNAGRNIFSASGFQQVDFSIFKDWKFRERYDAQFRVEIFNVFNHTNFADPGGLGTGNGFDDPSGGESGQFGCGCITPDQSSPNPVLGAGGARAMQLGLRLSF